ncbi:MAG TPA: hypothetical protein VJU82_02020, partial [Acidobacteriaceae bacterium]|nr:hypothetical protein [Acidobacteriaceae bacterium]
MRDGGSWLRSYTFQHVGEKPSHVRGGKATCHVNVSPLIAHECDRCEPIREVTHWELANPKHTNPECHRIGTG